MKTLGLTLSRTKLGRALAVSRRLTSFVLSLPQTYMGTAAYQVRAGGDGWMITERGSNLALEVFATKNEAVRVAKRLARAHKAHLDVFSRQGALQTHQSFA